MPRLACYLKPDQYIYSIERETSLGNVGVVLHNVSGVICQPFLNAVTTKQALKMISREVCT